MNTKRHTWSLAFAIAVLAGFSALAGTIEEKTIRQDERIKDGVESGSLTEKEAQRLNKAQERIEALEDKYAADGRLSRKEERKIRKLQAEQSQKIYKEKNDFQKIR